MSDATKTLAAISPFFSCSLSMFKAPFLLWDRPPEPTGLKSANPLRKFQYRAPISKPSGTIPADNSYLKENYHEH